VASKLQIYLNCGWSSCRTEAGVLQVLLIAVHFEHQMLLPVYTEAIALPY